MRWKHRLRQFTSQFLVLASLATPAFAATGIDSLSIPINRSELITSPREMSEVIVSDPTIADVFVHGRDKVSVIGKQLGLTTVRMFDTSNKLIRKVDVHVTYDLPAIRKSMRELLPHENISVEMLNTAVALTGQVSNAQAAATAVEIAQQFLVPKRTPEEYVSVNQRRNDSENNIINLLTITSGQQVMLRIRVGEIQRSALKNLGVNLQAVKSSGNTLFSIGTGSAVGSAARIGGSTFLDATGAPISDFGSYGISSESQGFFGASYRGSEYGFSGLIDALERDGLFKLLAEPNLVSISGEQARFLAGGEFPIPVPQNVNGGGSTITVDYKPFGVAVEFTPYVLSDNRIRIEVEPEVSEISNEGAIQVGGFAVPSFTTRRASTTVELAPGESFMIAGLLKDQMQSTIDQVPGVGEVPILNSLFRSNAYRRNETELVLAVTPYLVDPVRSSDVKLPTDDFRPATMMEMVFYGALGSLSGRRDQMTNSPGLEGPVGFMTD